MSFTKNLIKHSAIYSASGVLSKLIGFILLPVYTRVLTVEDFGVLALLGTFFGLFKTTSFFGMQTGVFRAYLHEAKSEEEKNKILSSFHWGLLFILGLISIPPVFFALPIVRFLGIDDKYAILVAFLFFNNFYRLIAYARNTNFRLHQLSTKYLVWNNIDFFSNIIIAIVLVVGLRLRAFGIIYAQVATTVMISTIFLPWFIRNLFNGFDARIFKRIFTYGAHFVLVNVSMWVLNLSDRFILNIFWGAGLVGYYSIGYRFGYIFNTFAAGLKNQWGYSLYKMGDPESVALYLSRTIMRYFALMALLWTVLTLFVREALMLMTPALYHHVYVIVPPIAFGYILLGVTTLLSAGIHLQRKGKWFWILSTIGALINIILNLIFIPRYGMIAASVTTLVAFTVKPIGFYIITRQKYNIVLPWPKLGQLFCMLLMPLAACYAIIINSIILSLLAKCSVFVMFLVILYKSDIVMREDKDRLRAYLVSKLKFLSLKHFYR
ncbi:lipopolysaccharide biosynthesis protein [Candidatus Omnitrophota bacterium]